MRQRKTSNQLILLIVALLCLAFFMAWFIHRTVSNLQHDAEAINRIGIIRGSMQRLVKLELFDQNGTNAALILSIDQLLDRFIREIDDDRRQGLEREVHFHIHNTARNWNALKASIQAYRQAPSERNRQQLLARSEEAWKAADAAVLAAQQHTEYKVADIRFFYLIAALNAANALLVLWVVYVYVRKRIEVQASYDTLTKLLNRNSFEQEVQHEIFRSRRYRHPFSLIIFDIDHFKKINDRYGHRVGDQVLAALGGLVKGMMRKSDQVFRIGGEEFAVLASETPGASAQLLAEKIRIEVEKHSFEQVEKVTVSLGVAQWRHDDDLSTLFRNSDTALYQAKESGRNRTCLYQ